MSDFHTGTFDSGDTLEAREGERVEIFNILKIAWSEKVQKKIQIEKLGKICLEKRRKKREKIL